MERMHFCPHCGTRLQPGFRFCPSCGVKLSGDSDPASPESVAYTDNNAEMDDTKKFEPCSPQIHSPARKTRQTAPNVKSHPVTPPSTDTKKFEPCSPQIHSPARKTRQTAHSVQSDPATPPSTGRRVFASPRKRKAIVQEDSEVCSASLLNTSPQTSSVVKGKSAKIMGAVHPLKEGVELNDQSGVKWKLMKLLHQNDNEITYKVLNGSVPSCLDQNYILRLAAKDGQIFTEQNFLQRAAKTVTVEKWVKRMKLDNLGMPTCLGFGLHDNYRFLVFEDMGQSLHSIIQSETKPLSQKVVLMLACRILDVLEFVHENEYTHADLHAENVYINSGSHPKAILSGFGRAFRFCPGGKHVEYREGSRAPHLGHHDFISLDVHLGAAPSRRSDLQSLGYCLIHWMTGALPWSSTTHKPNDIAAEKRRCLQDLSHLLHHCFGTEKVPGALQEYLCQVMNLTYSETPDYTQLKVGLRNGLQQMGVALEDPFDLHM